MAAVSRGRPTGEATKLFKDALMLELRLADGDKSELRAIAKKLVAKAKGGDMMGIREIADRIDGKVPQKTEYGGEGSEDIKHTITLKFE
jgi:hypothetical protein